MFSDKQLAAQMPNKSVALAAQSPDQKCSGGLGIG